MLRAYTLSQGTTVANLETLIDAEVSGNGALAPSSYRWGMMLIHNRHASQTLTVIPHNEGKDGTAPTYTGGKVLPAGESIVLDVNRFGVIEGDKVWVNASGASTTFDLMILPVGD